MKKKREPSLAVDRRQFMKKCGGWSLGVLLGAAAHHLLPSRVDAQEFKSPGFPRKPIPGSCIQPQGHVEETLAAVIDACVPGVETDPDGTPGGLEACAMNLLLDEYYPIKAAAPLVATLMDEMAKTSFSDKLFIELTHSERIEVLVEAQEGLPMLRLAYRAIRSAFYGGAYNGVGLDYLGYPGSNLGYRHIKAASFRRPVCKELTETGWMP